MKTTILAALLLLATTAACSSTSKTPTPTLSADQQKAVSSMSAAFVAGNGAFSVSTQQAADCVATDLVTQLGVDSLTSYGLLTADLKATGSLGDKPMTQADAQVTADVIVGCAGTAALFDAIEQSQQSTIPHKAFRCLRKKLDDASLKKLFVVLQSHNNDVASWGSDIIVPITSCIKTG